MSSSQVIPFIYISGAFSPADLSFHMSDPVAIHTLEVSSEAFNNLLEMFEGSFNRDTIEQTYRVRRISIFHLFPVVLNVVISVPPLFLYSPENELSLQ